MNEDENELILAQDKAQDKAQDEIVNEKISNMNEEEKRSIKFTKEYLEEEKNLRDDYKWKSGFYANGDIERLLNLIEKQQKEIEDLKEKNKTLEQLLQGNLYEMYMYYRELANSYQANCISKDKIKEKIEELEKPIQEGQCLNVIQGYVREGNLILLKELLGE